MTAKALTGFTVLDLSNFLAAPLCGMFLADCGAEVLKVERPGHGDEVRYWGENKDGVGLYGGAAAVVHRTSSAAADARSSPPSR